MSMAANYLNFLVGQIKQKLVSFQQHLLGMLNIKSVTISVSHQPTAQIKH